MVKTNLQMVGITRTGLSAGRGGMALSTFRLADYTPERDAGFSYWGIGYPGSDGKDAPGLQDATSSSGQSLSTNLGTIPATDAWHAINYVVESLLPTAEQAGVKIAVHPHDPAYPSGGLNGVEHVVGSIEGMQRLLAIAPDSPGSGTEFLSGNDR